VDLEKLAFAGSVIQMRTNAVSWPFESSAGCRRIMILIRDEEAVGSNPATPTNEIPVQGRSSAQGDRP
jgi:hypothetical protein